MKKRVDSRCVAILSAIDKVRSLRLKERGLLEREVQAGSPVRMLHSLTKQGLAFGAVA